VGRKLPQTAVPQANISADYNLQSLFGVKRQQTIKISGRLSKAVKRIWFYARKIK
jgi:hypothetical protein